MKEKINVMWVGVLLGVLVPFLALWIYSLIKFDDLSLPEFLKGYFSMGILTHVISLSVLPNLPLFFIFIQSNYLKAARGVLLSTILFAFAVLIIRFA